jgi:molecular chaperone DnaJ
MREETFHSPSDPLGYYATLGIGPLADARDIKIAYRSKAKRLHPDINPLDHAEQDFVALTTA